MQLLYKISYHSHNFFYLDLLKKYAKICKLKDTKVTASKDFILLDINDTDEKIKEYFSFLENNLALSIFLDKGIILKEYPKEEFIPYEKNYQDEDFLDNLEIKNILKEFENNKNNEQKNNKKKYEEFYKNLQNNKIQKFYETVFSLEALDENFSKENNFKNPRILFISLIKISKYFDVNKKEINLLSCIEKPYIKLGSSYFKKDVFLRLAKNKEELKLCAFLKTKGLDFIWIYEKKSKSNLEVSSFNPSQNIILRSDEKNFSRFEKNTNNEFIFYSNYLKYIKDFGGIYKVILREKNLRINSSIGIYFSNSSNKSTINVNVPSKIIKEIISIENIKPSIKNILKELEDSNQNAKKLIKNFKTKFKLDEDFICENKLGGLGTLEEILAWLLKISVDEFSYLAKGGENALKIDTKIKKLDNKNQLDYLKIIQAFMSYILADSDKADLANSYYIALGEFAYSNIEKIHKETNIKDIIVYGDLLENKIFLKIIQKKLFNYKLHTSSALPLDL